MVGDVAAGSVLVPRTQLPESLPEWLLPGDKKPAVPGGGDGNVDDDGGSFNHSSDKCGMSPFHMALCQASRL